MKARQKIVGIIPARGGSKSIPEKNSRLFHGKPLISWTIETALESMLDRVLVTTDSRHIQDIALRSGAEAPFLRPSSLAEDQSGIEGVLKHAHQFLLDSGYEADGIAMLLPTSPFRIASDINEAIELFKGESVSSVVSVTKAEANLNPHWMLTKNTNDQVMLFGGRPLDEIADRRQDLPEVYMRNDFIYVLKPENLYRKKPSLYGESVVLLEISARRYDIDINTEKDWIVAEAVFGYTRGLDFMVDGRII